MIFLKGRKETNKKTNTQYTFVTVFLKVMILDMFDH